MTEDPTKDALPEARDGPKSPDISPISTVPEATVFQKRKCSHISGTGAACGAYAVKNSTFCFYHDPSPEAIAKRERGLREKAKRANAQDGLENWTTHPIKTIEQLSGALSELFNAGMSGDITTNRLSALSSVANALMKSIEGSDLEARIKALEDKIGVKK